MDDRQLVEGFKEFGEVVSAKVIKDHETGRSRGFGFVNFREQRDMENAILKMDGQVLEGRDITVKRVRAAPILA